jgi:hypothetical protein
MSLFDDMVSLKQHDITFKSSSQMKILLFRKQYFLSMVRVELKIMDEYDSDKLFEDYANRIIEHSFLIRKFDCL